MLEIYLIKLNNEISHKYQNLKKTEKIENDDAIKR